jgi:folylpolyglutamate synthase/dihydropteroate synthase
MLAERSAHFIRTNFSDAADAVRQTLSLAGPDDVILACGSLYMIGDAKRVMLT